MKRVREIPGQSSEGGCELRVQWQLTTHGKLELFLLRIFKIDEKQVRNCSPVTIILHVKKRTWVSFGKLGKCRPLGRRSSLKKGTFIVIQS